MKRNYLKKLFISINFPEVSILDLLVNSICIIGIFFFSYNFFNVIKLGVERYNLIQGELNKLNELKAQEVKLNADLDWYSSLDFIEAQSRDFLNLANEGDSIIVFPESILDVALEGSNEEVVIHQSPDISRWINLFFKN